MSDADWRTQAFLILEKKFSEVPHLKGVGKKNGDYEVHCSKCGLVETYPSAGNKEVDAFTFAFNAIQRHAHKE